MSFLLKFLKSAPHIPEMVDQAEIKVKYKYWRIRIMYSMFLGYTFYYLTRKSFTAAMPGIMTDLHLDKGELGIMGTVLALSYGLSKFFSGVISDQSNPRYFMAFGLIITGILNIFIGMSSSLWFFVGFWALNGLFQGFGWPPCVKLLSNWYSHSERGSWWSSWAISQNIGAIVGPLIVGFFLGCFGWRVAMFAPGIICILGGFFLINRLADVPQSLGLPPIEKFRNDYADQSKKDSEEKVSSSKELMMSVLKNKYIWMLALAYFFIYFIRTGVGDWTTLFMMESKGYSYMGALSFVAILEVGGFCGMLSAGWMSDRLFKARRGPVNALYAIVLFLSILGFWYIPSGWDLVSSATMFVIGFAIFGPQMLIGVAVAELAHKNASATATGLAGWIAYIGSAVAGFPLGKLIDYLGWEGFFWAMVVGSAIPMLLLLPLWSVTRASLTVKSPKEEELPEAT